MFDFIYDFFGWLIRSFYNLLSSTGIAYAVALFMFALIIKIVLFPLAIKQQKNMQRQAKLRPKEMAIRKKYAGREDQATKQKMQNEVMEMYKEEKFNPASGCLPLLIQLPLLIMLYNVVRGPLTYIAQFTQAELNVLGDALAPLFNVSTYSIDTTNEIAAIATLQENSSFLSGEAAALMQKLPDLSLFGMDLTATPVIASWLVIIPILNLLASYFGQVLIRKMSYQPLTQDNAGGCSPKMMNIMMPLFSTYIAFQVPAALGLYWIYTNILSVVQQYILKKMYPTPVFTEEEMRAAEKQYAAAAKNKGGHAGKLPPKKSNSLVYDDDDDDVPAAPAPKKSKKSLLDDDGAEESTKTDSKGPIDKAPMKDDSDN